METDQAKLFLGGISRETTESALKEHFAKYGTVLGSVIAKDRSTGAPRGFGFVWFRETSAADKALQDNHVILGRTVEVKKAVPRSEQQQTQYQQQQQNRGLSRGSSGSSHNFRTKKIFVGGLSSSLTEEDFKSYFERFGRITDVVVMHDSTTHRPRGFGFITFDSEESVENVMEKNFHELNGRLVEVKRAVPKEGCNNGSGINMRAGAGRGSPYNMFWPGTFPTYGPRQGIPHGYSPFQSYGVFAGYLYGAGFPMGGYSGIGYGVPPLPPRTSWNSTGNVGVQCCLLPYGNASVHPPFTSPVPEVNGKMNQVVAGEGFLPAYTTPPSLEGLKLDVNSSDWKSTGGSSPSKQNPRGSNGQSKHRAVGASS